MREDLVASAESFLSNAKTQSANKEKKIAFLKSKGLSDNEIQEAFRRVDSAIVSQMGKPKPPPRPYRPLQIVSYLPEPRPRLTDIQLMKVAFLIGFSAFSTLTAATLVIKKIMSRILNKIARYQSHRYQQNICLLSRIELTLKKYYITHMEELDLQQSKLDQSITDMTNTLVSLKKEQTSFKSLKSCLIRFQNTLLQHPSIIPSHQDRLSFGFAASFADKYHAESDNNTLIQDIKSHIRSLKGTLLSRKNFPKATLHQQHTSIPPAPITIDPRENHPRKKASFRSELNK